MQTEEVRDEACGQSEFISVDTIVRILADNLEAERARVVNEIRTYPSPIPACDAQFNHLLEKRTRLSRELEGLHRIHEVLLSDASDMRQLQTFIESSEFIHPDTKYQMMTACGGHVSKQGE